jgi:hypothetical protein
MQNENEKTLIKDLQKMVKKNSEIIIAICAKHSLQ